MILAPAEYSFLFSSRGSTKFFKGSSNFPAAISLPNPNSFIRMLFFASLIRLYSSELYWGDINKFDLL